MMNVSKFRWTAWHISELKRRVENRESASEIAVAFGAEFTRNSVIGKAHRLGIRLNGGAGGGRKNPVVIVVPKTAPPVTIMDLKSDMCCWPFGDPLEDDFGFCGAHAPGGSPYCCEHRLVAYTGKSTSNPKPAFRLRPIGASRMLGEAAE